MYEINNPPLNNTSIDKISKNSLKIYTEIIIQLFEYINKVMWRIIINL